MVCKTEQWLFGSSVFLRPTAIKYLEYFDRYIDTTLLW